VLPHVNLCDFLFFENVLLIPEIVLSFKNHNKSIEAQKIMKQVS